MKCVYSNSLVPGMFAETLIFASAASLAAKPTQYFFVANALNRFTLSQRDKLKENADGSVDIYIQKDSPGAEKEANWLPAPEGKFVLMMRMYWPREKDPSILNGSWKPPVVKRVN